MSVRTTRDRELEERALAFLQQYYDDAIGELVREYPREERSLVVDYDDLFRYDPDLADDWREHPERFRQLFEDALELYDLPVDVDLAQAHVRLANLPEEHTYYPGEFSPTDRAGEYVAIEGELSKASDVYSRVIDAAFRCQRCESLTQVPQSDVGEFQEPHECRGCERQGPFQLDHEQSEHVDAQMLRVQTPPEVASGAGQDIDVYVEDDLVRRATVGDRVTVAGHLRLEQVTEGNRGTGKFEPWLEGHAVSLEDSDRTDLEIKPDERDRIQALVNGAEGDPLDVAAASLAPKVYGYDHIKRMAVLLMVSGCRVVYPSGDDDRGDFHMLLLGDPGTAKSKLLTRIEEISPRSVGVSGSEAKEAGLTTAAVRDDFGDSQWTLDAGAFVQANDGLGTIRADR